VFDNQEFYELFYEGTRVLKNHLNIQDQAALDDAEQNITENKLRTVPDVPMTFEGFKQVHRHVFEDIYPWAGEVRNYDISKAGMGEDFASHFIIESQGKKLLDRFAQFPKPDNLHELGDKAGSLLGGLNWLHPFREGNGRAMTAFLTQWTQEQGTKINFSEWSRTEWIQASHNAAFKQNNQTIIDTINKYTQTNTTTQSKQARQPEQER